MPSVFSPSKDSMLTKFAVLQRLHSTSKSSLDTVDSHRPQSFLEVVPHAVRISNYNLWPQRRRLGRHALPASLQRCTRHVPSNLQRHTVTAANMDRDRLADSKCAFLCHWLWSGPVEDTRRVLVGILETRWIEAKRDGHKKARRNTPRLVSAPRLGPFT